MLYRLVGNDECLEVFQFPQLQGLAFSETLLERFDPEYECNTILQKGSTICQSTWLNFSGEFSLQKQGCDNL